MRADVAAECLGELFPEEEARPPNQARRRAVALRLLARAVLSLIATAETPKPTQQGA